MCTDKFIYGSQCRSGTGCFIAVPSVGIDLKELGGQLAKCLKFCPGIEI